MIYLRRIVCIICALIFVHGSALALPTKDTAIPLENPTDDDLLYSYALNYFKDNEDAIRNAARMMLETGVDKVCIRYHRAHKDENGQYYVCDEIWVYNEAYGENIELFDEEYLALANCTGDFLVMTLRLCEGIVAVDFERYYEPGDYLNVHTFGYYYIPNRTDVSTEPESLLKECMPEEWSYQTNVMDEYQLVRISDDIVYYHWHG